MKKILIILLVTTTTLGYAQRPAVTVTYPKAGVATEQNFANDLTLPLVNAPIPSKNPKAAVTPQQLYSPNTNGGNYSAAELQTGSKAAVVTNVANAGGGATGGSVSGSSRGNTVTPSISSITSLPRKKKVVLADDLLKNEDETVEDGRSMQRLPELGDKEDINDENAFDGPVGDGLWVLLVLAGAYLFYRRKTLGS